MVFRKTLCLWIFLLLAFQPLCAISLATPLVEQFNQVGYLEIGDKEHGSETFDSLYAHFDNFIEFLQTNPGWA